MSQLSISSVTSYRIFGYPSTIFVVIMTSQNIRSHLQQRTSTICSTVLRVWLSELRVLFLQDLIILITALISPACYSLASSQAMTSPMRQFPPPYKVNNASFTRHKIFLAFTESLLCHVNQFCLQCYEHTYYYYLMFTFVRCRRICVFWSSDGSSWQSRD